MKHQDKPPRKKVSPRKDDPETTDGKRPDERAAPAAAERTDSETAPTPDNESATTSDRKHQPVTNQDEQAKITNAEESDLPVKEN